MTITLVFVWGHPGLQVPSKTEITTAAVSSAGKMAAAGCVDGMVYLYHLTSGRWLPYQEREASIPPCCSLHRFFF
jgi:hypothetical protein